MQPQHSAHTVLPPPPPSGPRGLCFHALVDSFASAPMPSPLSSSSGAPVQRAPPPCRHHPAAASKHSAATRQSQGPTLQGLNAGRPAGGAHHPEHLQIKTGKVETGTWRVPDYMGKVAKVAALGLVMSNIMTLATTPRLCWYGLQLQFRPPVAAMMDRVHVCSW